MLYLKMKPGQNHIWTFKLTSFHIDAKAFDSLNTRTLSQTMTFQAPALVDDIWHPSAALSRSGAPYSAPGDIWHQMTSDTLVLFSLDLRSWWWHLTSALVNDILHSSVTLARSGAPRTPLVVTAILALAPAPEPSENTPGLGQFVNHQHRICLRTYQ